jgi:uncharacterized cupin superfamily protein
MTQKFYDGRAIAVTKDNADFIEVSQEDGSSFGKLFRPVSQDWEGRPFNVGMWRGLGSSGSHTHPMDEAFYIIQGWMEMITEKGETIRLEAGDFIAFNKGTTVQFKTSPDMLKFSVAKP